MRMSEKTKAWRELDKAAIHIANAAVAMKLAGMPTDWKFAAQDAIADAQTEFRKGEWLQYWGGTK